MAWQLVFTSAPRGLAVGRSGFCTVARPKEMRDLLVTAIERISSFHHLRGNEAGSAVNEPVISSLRILELRGSRYYLLTRMRDCGLDYTNRTNHIAHHLIFSEEEIGAFPSPAYILHHWSGWLSSWQGEPRFFGPQDEVTPALLPAPTSRTATHWKTLTGDAGHAALLISPFTAQGCGLQISLGQEDSLLDYYHETLQSLLPANGPSNNLWQIPFTTFFQASNSITDFRWKGVWPSTAHLISAAGQPLLDLTHPASLPAPEADLAHAVREEIPPTQPVIQTLLPEKSSSATIVVSELEPLAPFPESPDTSATQPSSHPAPIRPRLSHHRPHQKKSSPFLWVMAFAAMALIAGFGAFLVFSSLKKEDVRPAPVTEHRPIPPMATNENFNFAPLPPAPTNTTFAPTPVPPPPSAIEPTTNLPTLPPLPLPTVNLDGLDSDNLPKRPITLIFGSLQGPGITIVDSTAAAHVSALLSKASELRLLRLPSTVDISAIPTEKIEQRIPGTHEIVPGKFYSATLEEILSYRSQGSALNLRSPSFPQALLTPALPSSTETALLFVSPANLLNQPLLSLPRSWIEMSGTPPAKTVSISSTHWETISQKILFASSGNWRLLLGAGMAVSPSIPSSTGSAPSADLSITPQETRGLEQLRKDLKIARDQLAAANDVIVARNALFNPDLPFDSFGQKFLGIDSVKLNKELASIATELKSTKLKAVEKDTLRNVQAILEKRLKLLTFTEFQKSEISAPTVPSNNPGALPDYIEQTLPKDYIKYLRRVLASREIDIARGVFLNEKTESLLPDPDRVQSSPPDLTLVSANFSSPETVNGLASDKAAFLKASIELWQTTFSKSNVATLTPFFSTDLWKSTLRREVSDQLRNTATVQQKNVDRLQPQIESIEKRTALMDKGVSTLGPVFLIWESDGQAFKIATFPE